MRTKWMLGGIFGLTAAVASASPNVPFATVINSGDPVGDQFYSTGDQVVAGPNGTVAIEGESTDSLGDLNSIIIYSTPTGPGTWSSQAVAVAGDTYNFPAASGEQFNAFNNLAVTGGPNGTRLTFGAVDTNSNYGVLQWDATPATLQDVAISGDSNGYTNVGGGGTYGGGAQIELQVNGSGQALFPAVSAASQSVIVRGDSTSLTNVFTADTNYSNANTQTYRLALAGDNTSAAVLDNLTSGARGVYSIPAAGGTPTNLSSPYIVGSGATDTSDENAVVGYTSGGGSSAALMLVSNPSNGTQDLVLGKNGGSPQPIVAPFTIPAGATPQGQMAPNGQITAYVPNGSNDSGDTIIRSNAAAPGYGSTVVASVYSASNPTDPTGLALDPTGGLPLKIIALDSATESPAPEINSNGIIVFTAEVGTSTADEKTALLESLPGSPSPEILLADGDTVPIDGTPEVIADFSLNNLGPDYDYYKNALNDQNGLAVAVDYSIDSFGDTDGAVLYTNLTPSITSIPEPTTIGLLSLGTAGLLKRRKRQ